MSQRVVMNLTTAKMAAAKNRSNPNRRTAHPIGELFDPPCGQCIKHELSCEKDKYAAACIRCYIRKNCCDYGNCYFQTPSIYKKGRGRGKGRLNENMK